MRAPIVYMQDTSGYILKEAISIQRVRDAFAHSVNKMRKDPLKKYDIYKKRLQGSRLIDELSNRINHIKHWKPNNWSTDYFNAEMALQRTNILRPGKTKVVAPVQLTRSVERGRRTNIPPISSLIK